MIKIGLCGLVSSPGDPGGTLAAPWGPWGGPWRPTPTSRELLGNNWGTTGELPGRDPFGDPLLGTLSTDPRSGVGGGVLPGSYTRELPGNYRGTSRRDPRPATRRDPPNHALRRQGPTSHHQPLQTTANLISKVFVIISRF